jgi:transcription antitermination factor NusG
MRSALISEQNKGKRALAIGNGQVGTGPAGSGEVVLVEDRSTGDCGGAAAHGGEIVNDAELRHAPSVRWYLEFTGTNQELRVVTNLKRQGSRPFLPRIQKSVRHAWSIRLEMALVFRRYVFLPLALDRGRRLSVRSTFGVTSLFMSGARPGPVPHRIVEAILDRVDGSGATRLDAGLQAGDYVRILSSPFADSIGTLSHLDDNGRVRVLLDVMDMATPVTLPRSALMPA